MLDPPLHSDIDNNGFSKIHANMLIPVPEGRDARIAPKAQQTISNSNGDRNVLDNETIPFGTLHRAVLVCHASCEGRMTVEISYLPPADRAWRGARLFECGELHRG